MNIQKADIQWRYALTPLDLSKVDAIALHHMAHPTSGIEEIDKWHKDKGWNGFAYNYWIGFDGQIWEGRGLNRGAGVTAQNDHIINIGFQGNYEPFKDVRGNMVQYKTEMPQAQYEAGVWLIRHLLKLLPSIKVVEGHKYFEKTSCPGKYFPLEQMKGESVLTWEQKNKEFVKRFQTATGLTADGLAGNDTNNMFDSVESILRDFTGQKGNYPRIELKQQGGAKYIETDPFKMESVDVHDYASNLVKQYPNFTGGMFSHPKGRLINLLITNGKKVYEPAWWDLGNKGTFIVYDSGKVEVISTRDIKDPTGIKLAFQGFNLDYEVNGSKNINDSIAKEYWGSDVARKCYRVGWGYNYRTKKAMAVLINGTAEELRQALRAVGCVDINNNTCGIGVDAGSMTAFAVNGKLIHVGDNGRVGMLQHIIKF